MVWNVHRIYGSVRLPLLLEGWSVLACSGFEDVVLQPGLNNAQQPVMLLAPSAARGRSSWNLPPEACVPQLQELGLCPLDAGQHAV